MVDDGFWKGGGKDKWQDGPKPSPVLGEGDKTGCDARKTDSVVGADQPVHQYSLISTFVLAHRIRISEILPWDRKSLTQEVN